MSFSVLVVRIAAAVAAGGFVLLGAFQVFLALGVAWGRAAWGGVYEGVLPPGLRVASAISSVVLLVASLVVLGRAGYWGDSLPFGIFRWGTWALVAMMALSAVANFAASSSWERFVWGPLALLLAFTCLIVALG